MPDYRLRDIAQQMIATAKVLIFDGTQYEKFEKSLSGGLRLSCYRVGEQFWLDIERQFRDLEPRESWITRGCFGVPRDAWTKPLGSGDGWRGVRVAWGDAPKVETREAEQGKLFD